MTITQRIDAITKISPEYLGAVLPAPKSVKIEITANCDDVIIAECGTKTSTESKIKSRDSA